MKSKSKINFPVIYYILYLIIPYTISYLFGIALKMDMTSATRFMYTILIAVSINLISIAPLLLFFVLVLLTIGIVLLNYYVYGNKALVEWIWKFLWNIIQHVQGKEEILDENITVLWVMLVVLLCIFTYWTIFKTRRPFVLIPVYYGILIYYWYVYIDQAYHMMIMFTFGMILLFSLQAYEKEKFRFEYRPWVKITICYGIIAILVGAILPKGGNLIYWPWLESKMYHYFPAIGSMRIDVIQGGNGIGNAVGLFSLRQTGFNPEGSRLGGPVKQSDKEVMTVKSADSLYLRGRVSEIYEGNQWTTGKWNKSRTWFNRNLPREVEENEIIEILITYTNLSSSTLFTPYMPIVITDVGSKPIFADENKQIIVPSSIAKGETYRVRSILPNAEGSFEMEPSMYLDYYLQLPSSISNEVYTLSKTITQGIHTKYEKAVAIENYLQKNYSYSLEVPYVPKNKEFVDYFLFEDKQGYCTYFATAMAVLLRSEGIPSRYVEGYLMPQESQNGVYKITQKQAHAWVEAYIEGKGWITFDPTPSGIPPATRRNSVINIDQQDEIFSDELYPGEISSAISRNGAHLEIYEQMGIEGEVNTIENHTGKLSNLFNVSKGYLFVMILLALLIWLLINGSISYFRRRKYDRWFQQLSLNEQSVNIYNDIIIMLEQIGYIRNNGETPYEYAQRIARKVYNYQLNFNDVTEIYLKAKYSNVEISMEEKDILVEYLSYIEKKLKVMMGKWKYTYYKYFSYK